MRSTNYRKLIKNRKSKLSKKSLRGGKRKLSKKKVSKKIRGGRRWNSPPPWGQNTSANSYPTGLFGKLKIVGHKLSNVPRKFREWKKQRALDRAATTTFSPGI